MTGPAAAGVVLGPCVSHFAAMRLDAPRDRTTRPRDFARAMAYVARDGAVAARPFSLVAALWGALDVVDAFFRTLLVEGHADAYARRTTTARATTPERVAATTARGARARGFANVRTIDHAAPTAGG